MVPGRRQLKTAPPASDIHGEEGTMRGKRIQRTELFVFPDGSAVEVLVFDCPSADVYAAGGLLRASTVPDPTPEAESTAPASPAPPLAGVDAHVCKVCGSRLAFPVEWQRRSKSTWEVIIRCPECETLREVTMTREHVEELNKTVHVGFKRLAEDGEDMCRRHFVEESAKLLEALRRDLILPMDF
jgi:hypothetical protein